MVTWLNISTQTKSDKNTVAEVKVEIEAEVVSFKTPNLFVLKHEYCQRLFKQSNDSKNNQTKEFGAWW